jgi:hypothetical protein
MCYRRLQHSLNVYHCPRPMCECETHAGHQVALWPASKAEIATKSLPGSSRRLKTVWTVCVAHVLAGPSAAGALIEIEVESAFYGIDVGSTSEGCAVQASPRAPPNTAKEAGFGIQKHAKAHIGDEIPGSDDYNPAPHPSHLATDKGEDYLEKHPVYTQEYVESIVPSHRPPKGVRSCVGAAFTKLNCISKACHAGDTMPQPGTLSHPVNLHARRLRRNAAFQV